MYGANLIYGVRLRVNVGERKDKKNLKGHRYIVLEKKKKKKKNLKKTSFVSDEQFRKSNLNVNFF